MSNKSSVVYLDAMCFCYALEGDDQLAAPPRELLTALSQYSGAIATSELTLAEVMAGVEKRRNPLLKRLYHNLLIGSRVVTLAPVSRDVLLESAEVRAHYPGKLNLADAIHLVTAIQLGCRYFMTNDFRIKTSPQGGPLLVKPDAEGVAAAIAAMAGE